MGKNGSVVVYAKGGTRYYSVSDLLALGDVDAPTVCYARVFSHDHKADLDRQRDVLETYGVAKGWRMQVICDFGSGMNYRKKGLHQLLEMILRCQMRRLVITGKDRLLRFGAELIFAVCERRIFEYWERVSRFVFNWTIDFIRTHPDQKPNWMAIKTQATQRLPEWTKVCPLQMNSKQRHQRNRH
jgi:predicted site-specific integrase-resolvase